MINIAEKAKEIATKAHTGQTRKFGVDKGQPYIIHPQRVATRFAKEDLQAIAWLHDTLEDSSLTIEDLRKEGFPEYILAAVSLLTHLKTENYLEYILRIRNNYWAVEVKLGDLDDNMSDLAEGSLKDKYRMAKYILVS